MRYPPKEALQGTRATALVRVSLSMNSAFEVREIFLRGPQIDARAERTGRKCPGLGNGPGAEGVDVDTKSEADS